MAIGVIYDKATCLEVGRFGSHPEVKIPITGVVDPKVERYRLVPYKLAFACIGHGAPTLSTSLSRLRLHLIAYRARMNWRRHDLPCMGLL
jgi:hypothetical protein